MTGIIFDIQRFCLHDGPGIRTTVFLKGCNMRCPWCHNPESYELMPAQGYGQEIAADDIITEVMKDAKYYATSGGGITFSGGEPTFQPDFLLELATKAKAHNLHICLETNGLFCDNTRERLLPLVDLWLYDYKATNNHKEHTGASNKIPLHNLAMLNQAGASIILRCPIIPGVNDNDTHYQAIENLKGAYACIKAVDFLPYHNLGGHKRSLFVGGCLEKGS